MMIKTNGHGKCAAHDYETRNARFPLSSSLPQAGERGKVSLREFHVYCFGGFTLIELLVALVILVLLSLAGYRGLEAVLQTREHLAQETRKWQHLALFFSQLEQDVAQAIPRPVQDQGGLTQPAWIGRQVVVADDEAELTFTRAGIPDQGVATVAPQRIGYRLQQGTILLLRWPFPDQAPLTKPLRYPLLDGVREFHLRHLDINGNWLEQWPPGGQPNFLPMALEVAITLASGEKIIRVFALQ